MKKILVVLLTLVVIAGFGACRDDKVADETSEIIDITMQDDEIDAPNSLELKIQTKEVDGKTYFVSDGLEMLYPNLWVIADMTEKEYDFYFIQADKFVDKKYVDMVYTNIFPDAEQIWDLMGPLTDENIKEKLHDVLPDIEIIEPLEINGHTFSRFKTLELQDVNKEALGMSVIHFAVVGDDSYVIATGTNEENLVREYYSEDGWKIIESMTFKNVDKFVAQGTEE